MTRLSSLAGLVILIFATLIAPVSAQSTTLTPALLSKMLDQIAKEGNDREVPASLANPLGLSPAGKAWPSRESGARNTATKILHAVYAGRGGDENMMLTVGAKEGVHVFRIRRDGTLLGARLFDLQTRQSAELGRVEAQKELEAELVFWRNFLDSPDHKNSN